MITAYFKCNPLIFIFWQISEIANLPTAGVSAAISVCDIICVPKRNLPIKHINILPFSPETQTMSTSLDQTSPGNLSAGGAEVKVAHLVAAEPCLDNISMAMLGRAACPPIEAAAGRGEIPTNGRYSTAAQLIYNSGPPLAKLWPLTPHVPMATDQLSAHSNNNNKNNYNSPLSQ